MASGLLSGLFWGAVLSVGAAVALSTMIPLASPRPQVYDAGPEPVARLAPEPVLSNAPEITLEPEILREKVEVAGAGTLLPERVEPTPPKVVQTEPAAQPQTGGAEELVTPTPDEAAQIAHNLAGDSAVLPSPQALAPMDPPDTDGVRVDTAPAPRPAPRAVIATTPEPAPELSERAPQIAQAPLVSNDPPLAGTARPEEGAPRTDSPQVAANPQARDAPLVDERSDNAPRVKTIISEAPSEPAPQPQENPVVQAEDSGEIETAAEAARPRIGTPAGTLTDRGNGVRINRSVSAPETPDAAEDSTADAGTGAEGDENIAPLQRFAREFTNPDDKPLMAIVLVDEGADLRAADMGLSVLRKFPYPVSIAIDASLPDANARMDAYRAEGFEVLAMVDLPEGAQPADAEVNLSVALEKLPDTVAVLDGMKGGLQPSRETADQVTTILAGSGHGLVAQAQGLNTMPKLANKAGVPAAAVFRDFDSNGQTEQVIRRFLDQAAFKAGQEGAVIMLGRIRPETIEALLVWGLADRAGKVALAPVSAVLLAQ